MRAGPGRRRAVPISASRPFVVYEDADDLMKSLEIPARRFRWLAERSSEGERGTYSYWRANTPGMSMRERELVNICELLSHDTNMVCQVAAN